MKGFKFKNQFVRFMLLVLVLSVAWAACSGSRETAEPGESASDNASDNALGYIMKHIEQGVTYQLDLSHPLQHQYVTDTLNGAGFNEENSPQSFAQLAATGNMKKELKPDDPKPAQPIPGLEFAPIHYISNFSVKGSEFSLTGLSTMPRGAPQTIRTHVLVTLLDQKGKVLTRESSDQFHVTPGGTYVSINVSGEIPEDKIPKEKEMLTANALFLIYPQDGGEPIAAYSKTASDQFLTYPQKSGRPTGANSKTEGDDSQVDTTAACMEKPICSVSCQNPPTCSNDDPGKKIIVCVNRDWITDCDEKVDNCCGFQVKGSMTFKNRLDTTSGAAAGKGTVTISLTMEQGGGYTLYSVSGNLDGAYFTLSGDEKEVLSWNFPKGTFSSGCGISGTYLSDFTMNISVTKADATGNQSGTFTSNTGQTGDDIYYVPKIDFLSGCFAAGTKILMADGSSKEIEAFTGNGDETVKTGSGEILNVIGTTLGVEPLPMIRIKDEKGGDVLITDGHPVFTVSRGVVLARNLKEGDIVKRIDGNAKITSITSESYDGMVYNLRLGTLEDGGQDKTSLFANGILMGDNMMQRYYGRLDKQKPLNQKNVLKHGLPKEWLKDFQYSESKKQE